MDAEGKTVIPSQKGGCSQFSEGLARMETSDGAYYIDHGGNKVLSSPAPEAFDFHNGLARVGEWWEDGGWRGYIDHAGKVVWSSGKLPAKNTRRK
jgi:hypothetical protein